MVTRKSAAVAVPSQKEYVQASDAFETFAGNQCSRKFEVMASPASRSDFGRKLQNRTGRTPGAAGASEMKKDFRALTSDSLRHRQAEIAIHRIRQIDDELLVVGRH